MHMSSRRIDRIREKCMRRHRSIRSKGIQGYKSGWKSVPCVRVRATVLAYVAAHTRARELPFCNKIQRRA